MEEKFSDSDLRYLQEEHFTKQELIYIEQNNVLFLMYKIMKEIKVDDLIITSKDRIGDIRSIGAHNKAIVGTDKSSKLKWIHYPIQVII